MSDWVYSLPSIRLGAVFPPDFKPVSEGIEVAFEHLEPDVKISKAQGSIIRDPDEPLEDPFEAEEPVD